MTPFFGQVNAFSVTSWVMFLGCDLPTIIILGLIYAASMRSPKVRTTPKMMVVAQDQTQVNLRSQGPAATPSTCKGWLVLTVATNK
jgi:hypothetical protein